MLQNALFDLANVLTLIADSIIVGVWVGVTCLVLKTVHSPYTQEAPATLRTGNVDWVSHTPIC